MRYKRLVYNMLYLCAAFVVCYLPPFCILIVIQVCGYDRAANIATVFGNDFSFCQIIVEPYSVLLEDS